MDVQKLQGLLAPFRSLCSRNALATHYKCLELSAELVTGAASYGILQVAVKLDMPAPGVCYVDAHTFLSVLSSLPDKAELKLQIDGGVLLWQAGAAKGKLALVDVSNMPQIPEMEQGDLLDPYDITKELVYALECGTISCTDQSLATVGMYGIVLDNREFPAVCTSDNTTAAFCAFADEAFPGFPDVCTLPPDAVRLLNEIIDKGGVLQFHTSGEALLYMDDTSVFYMKTMEPMKVDIMKLVERFSGGDNVVPIPPDRIKAFIKRAAAIAESKRNTFVSLGAEEGHLYLSFAEGAAAADEYYLVEQNKLPDMEPVQLDAGKLARALEQATEVVLDYMPQNVIVLSNSATGFLYVVSGRSVAS